MLLVLNIFNFFGTVDEASLTSFVSAAKTVVAPTITSDSIRSTDTEVPVTLSTKLLSTESGGTSINSELVSSPYFIPVWLLVELLYFVDNTVKHAYAYADILYTD